MSMMSFDAMSSDAFESAKLMHVVSRGNDYRKYYFHKHEDFCEIIFIERGPITYFINQEQHVLASGDIALINAQVVHSEFFDKSLDIRKHTFCTPGGDFYEQGIRTVVPPGVSPIVRKSEKTEELTQLLVRIISETQRAQSNYREVTQGLFFAFFFLLQRHILEVRDFTPPVLNKGDLLFAQIKSYLDINYHHNLSLSSVADSFFISPYYLSHLFKEKMGCAPMSYVISLRIGEAQHLLVSSELSIQEISEKVGYPNMNYFMTLFKRYAGMPPGGYRRCYTSEFISQENRLPTIVRKEIHGRTQVDMHPL